MKSISPPGGRKRECMVVVQFLKQLLEIEADTTSVDKMYSREENYLRQQQIQQLTKHLAQVSDNKVWQI